MRTSIPFSCFFLIGIVGTIAVPDIRAQISQELILKEAESRLGAIYDRKEFRAKRFRADWLPDSSGYTVLESVPDAKERVLVRYDAASGKRTVLNSPQKEDSGRYRWRLEIGPFRRPAVIDIDPPEEGNREEAQVFFCWSFRLRNRCTANRLRGQN